MLIDAGVGGEGLAFFRDAGRTLKKDQIHAFFGAYSSDGQSVQAPIFSQPSELDSWSRWKRFLEAGRIEIPSVVLENLERFAAKGFMGGPCYESSTNAPGALCLLNNVELKDLEAIGLDSAAFERVETLLRLAGRRRVSRLEWKVSGQGRSSAAFYCG